MADMSLGVLVVDIAANLAEFEKEVDKAKTTLEGWGKKIAPATAAMGAAFVGLAGSIAYAVKSFSDAHEAQIRLATALQATGQAVNVAPFLELASAIQATTGFEDDAAVAASAMMARFGLLEGQISTLLPSIADFAAFMGTDLPDAANQIGRAVVTGTVGPLVRAGIAFDDASKAAFENASIAERVAIAHDKLKNSVGGAATALAGTASGAFAQMKNAFGDIAETVGSAFEPIVVGALQKVTAALAAFNGWLSQLSPTMKGIGVVAAGAALAFTGISATWGAAILILPKLIVLMKSLSVMLAGVGASAAVATVAIIAVAAAGVALGDMVKASGGTAEGFFSDLPLIAKGAALGVLDSLETIFGMAPGTIEDALGKALDKIKGWASSALSAVASLGGRLYDSLLGALSGLGDLFGSAGSAIGDLFASAIEAVFGSIPSSITAALADALATVKGFAADVWTTMKDVGASIVNAILESLGVVGRAIKEFAGAVGDIFGTAGKYWGDKLGGMVGGGAPAAAPAGGAPAAGGAADTVQNQLGKLADDLAKFGNALAASSNESKTLAPLMRQFNAAMKGGLTPAEATAFSKKLTAAGVSMEQFKGYVEKQRAAYAAAIQATQDFGKEVTRGSQEQSAAANLVSSFRNALADGFSKSEAAAFNAELASASVSLDDFKRALEEVAAVESSLARLKIKLGQDEAAQLAYFADTLAGFMQFGASAADMARFNREVTKAGLSLGQVEDAAVSAAQVEKERGWFKQFKAAAHTATTEWLDQFNDSMLSAADGTTTALGDIYNVAVDTFGGNLVEGAIEATADFASFVGRGAAAIAQGLLPSMGAFGQVVQAGIQGFQSGGIFGAIIAVIIALISKLDAFKGIVEMLNHFLQFVLDALNPFLSTLVPLIGSILTLVQIVLSLVNAISFSQVAVSLLTKIFGALAIGINYLAQGIAWIVNMLFEFVADVLDFFGASDWAKSVRESKLDVEDVATGYSDAFASAYEEPTKDIAGAADDLGDSFTGLDDSMGSFGDSVEEASESLTNVPQGFKIAAARFASSMPESADVGGGVAGGASGGTTNIGNVYITSDNPAAVWSEIKKIIAWENFAGTGTPIPSGAAYSTPSTGS